MKTWKLGSEILYKHASGQNRVYRIEEFTKKGLNVVETTRNLKEFWHDSWITREQEKGNLHLVAGEDK